MGTVFAGIRAFFGLVGAFLGLRRRRMLLLERRQRLGDVLTEVVSNLAGIRRVWSEEHGRLNWRAWLHRELLRTRAWREHKTALTTVVDGGPAIDPGLTRDLDALYDEFENAARGSHAFSSDWERRLVDIASRLCTALECFPRRRLDRLAVAIATPLELPHIDRRVRTPSSPAEMQRRALERIPRGSH